jgi:hypothetical protein
MFWSVSVLPQENARAAPQDLWPCEHGGLPSATDSDIGGKTRTNQELIDAIWPVQKK